MKILPQGCLEAPHHWAIVATYGVVYYRKLDSICSHNGLNNFCGFICEPDAFQQHCGSGTGQDNTPVAQDDTPAAAGNYSNVVHL